MSRPTPWPRPWPKCSPWPAPSITLRAAASTSSPFSRADRLERRLLGGEHGLVDAPRLPRRGRRSRRCGYRRSSSRRAWRPCRRRSARRYRSPARRARRAAGRRSGRRRRSCRRRACRRARGPCRFEVVGDFALGACRRSPLDGLQRRRRPASRPRRSPPAPPSSLTRRSASTAPPAGTASTPSGSFSSEVCSERTERWSSSKPTLPAGARRCRRASRRPGSRTPNSSTSAAARSV